MNLAEHENATKRALLWIAEVWVAVLLFTSEAPMIECKDLAGKVIKSVTLFENGTNGPEVSIDLEDGSNFNVCLSARMALEARWTRDDGGEPQLLSDYTN
jgi:hypothetical protein